LSFCSYYGAPPALHSFPTRRSSDLPAMPTGFGPSGFGINRGVRHHARFAIFLVPDAAPSAQDGAVNRRGATTGHPRLEQDNQGRSEEHTSELQSVRISYAVFCLKKKRRAYRRMHTRTCRSLPTEWEGFDQEHKPRPFPAYRFAPERIHRSGERAWRHFAKRSGAAG